MSATGAPKTPEEIQAEWDLMAAYRASRRLPPEAAAGAWRIMAAYVRRLQALRAGRYDITISADEHEALLAAVCEADADPTGVAVQRELMQAIREYRAEHRPPYHA